VNDEVERLLAKQQPPVTELARKLCGLIMALYPAAVVSVDGGDIGFGRGTGYSGLVFAVTPHRRHVNLGIAQGVGLPDPAGLMQGTGKVHRHVKLREIADVERPELRELMLASLARRR
jgi:hypothetical protein